MESFRERGLAPARRSYGSGSAPGLREPIIRGAPGPGRNRERVNESPLRRAAAAENGLLDSVFGMTRTGQASGTSRPTAQPDRLAGRRPPSLRGAIVPRIGSASGSCGSAGSHEDQRRGRRRGSNAVDLGKHPPVEVVLTVRPFASMSNPCPREEGPQVAVVLDRALLGPKRVACGGRGLYAVAIVAAVVIKSPLTRDLKPVLPAPLVLMAAGACGDRSAAPGPEERRQDARHSP